MTREKMKPKYDLEDYIHDVQSRSLEPSADPEDLYAQLQQKEKDLILAAEVGKALLEKNEELSRANEKLAEDYSKQLEIIEQDRHQLRRKLTSLQSDCESRLVELQADIFELRRALAEKETTMKQSEKEKNALILELTEQNQRLTTQMKESSEMEEQLSLQLQSLKEQAFKRKSSFHDHQSSLDVLRDEITMMSRKKQELERRVQTISQQKDDLNRELEEAHLRIMLLEREMREQQNRINVSNSELEELKTSGSMSERLPYTSIVNGQRSLHSEMECDDSMLPQGDEFHQIKVEIVNVYDRVRAVCHSLKQRLQQPLDSVRPDITVHQVKVGLLSAVLQELCDLVSDFTHGDYSSSSVSVTDLEIELHRAQESLDKISKEMDIKTEELKRRSDVIMDLTSKLSVRETELDCAKEERDQARTDLQNSDVSKDELIRKAWEVRDSAVSRKNNTQIELARSRIEVMQANSQLMEAIQQKVELSQQLEQWQMDMQALLDEQMRKKLANPEQPTSGQNSPASAEKKRSSRRLFGIFQR